MWRRPGLLAAFLLLAVVPTVHGVITRLVPLREVLASNPFILTAKVESVDADKLTAVFVADEDLKGKFPVRRLLVNLTGDAEAKKDKHTEILLKRLASNLTVILFVDQRGNNFTLFGYTNGTWFQMVATKQKEVEKTVFAFTHGEPYLRRTFKGTTEEMKKVVVEGLAGKTKPPEPEPKEPPGFGPEVKPENQPEAQATVALKQDHGRKPAQLRPDKNWLRIINENGNGLVMSSPCIAGNRAYVSAAHGVLARFGVVYCIDLDTKKTVWSFDDEQAMKQGYSSPILADGRLYFGEGLHEDQNCKFYCLDAKTGKKLWAFSTKSHTEATPVVVDGKVYFGAGDDGIYCLDAVSGKRIWQFNGPDKLHLHVDSTPALVGKRLYCGSGLDEDTAHGDPSIFCIEADTGKLVWLHRTPAWTCKLDDKKRTPRPVPAWASPAAADGVIYFGIGNGRVNGPSNVFEPAGGLLAVDATTGKEVWPAFKVPDGVLDGLAVDKDSIYFGCRDGNCYCLDRKKGELRWKTAMGSAVIAAPVMARSPRDGSTLGVFVIGSEGVIACLDPATGKADWRFADLEKASPLLISTPMVVVTETGKGFERRLYLGATFNGLATPALYSLQDFQPVSAQ